MRKTVFDISGMSCSACSARVDKAVSALDGAGDVTVNLLKNTLSVTMDPAVLSPADIVAAVTKAGYGASPRGGAGGPARGDAISGGGMRAGKSGHSGKSGGASGDPLAAEEQALRQRLKVSLAFTVPLFFLAMGPMISMSKSSLFFQNGLVFALTQLLLTLPVLFANRDIFRRGVTTLLSGAPNMDSLIAIGSGAATLFSVYALYRMAFALGRADMATDIGFKLARHFAANLYFDSAAMILTLITLGKFFEARAKGKTSEAITRLMDLAPQTATVIREGKEETVAREDIATGDILAVKAGERVPVDGVITEGNGFLDESALTGESLPLEKRGGDPVTGATINQSGYFYMRATRVGEDTTLAQIIRLVDEATSSKAPIARLADKISGVFVPLVIGIAFAATSLWLLLGQNFEFALSTGIAVLVISCPCALGLATPTAIMVGTGRGAAKGILFKSAEAIETAGSIDTVVLDKTGTLTEGRPVVTDILATVSETELLTLAASLERLSEHPLGAAIVQKAEERGLVPHPVESFRQTPGQGISGNIDGVLHRAGNANILPAEGIADTLRGQAENFAAEGKTTLYFTRGGHLLGVIALADVIRASSPQAIAGFAAMGIELVMLTGDNAQTAEAVRGRLEAGAQTNIARFVKVVAEVLPQNKERLIRELQEQGKKVAMVGDGVNDAPALARADVGIAIGAGTDVALESADIVLMKNELPDAVAAIRLSRAVMRTIRQNLFWAFFYNCVGIPVAAGALYNAFGITLSPMIAAAAMSFSSVSVVSNALRLRLFDPALPRSDEILQNEPREACAAAVPHSEPSTRQRTTPMQKIISIEGMNCGHCSASVEKALKALEGVSAATVDLAAKSATVEVENVPDETLAKAVTDAGFQVVGIH